MRARIAGGDEITNPVNADDHPHTLPDFGVIESLGTGEVE
jgi:hypothetical protein